MEGWDKIVGLSAIGTLIMSLIVMSIRRFLSRSDKKENDLDVLKESVTKLQKDFDNCWEEILRLIEDMKDVKGLSLTIKDMDHKHELFKKDTEINYDKIELLLKLLDEHKKEIQILRDRSHKASNVLATLMRYYKK